MEPAAASAPAFDKPPSRCAQPGHKKAQQSEQLRELSRGAAAAGATAKASAPAAAHASVFSLAASAGLMDVFLEGGCLLGALLLPGARHASVTHRLASAAP